MITNELRTDLKELINRKNHGGKGDSFVLKFYLNYENKVYSISENKSPNGLLFTYLFRTPFGEGQEIYNQVINDITGQITRKHGCFEVGKTYYGHQNRCYNVTIINRTKKTITAIERIDSKESPFGSEIKKRINILGGKEHFDVPIFGDVYAD